MSLNIVETKNIFFPIAEPIAKFDKCYATGFCILENAKRIMYDQYYRVLMPTFKKIEIGASDVSLSKKS